MGAMDARRLELYELLKPKLDEEPAKALVLALGPDPENLATKDDVRALEGRMDVRFGEIGARFDRLENVLTRRMITILGAWTILVGSTVGWVSVLLR